jgi:hypothetical protein
MMFDGMSWPDGLMCPVNAGVVLPSWLLGVDESSDVAGPQLVSTTRQRVGGLSEGVRS